MSGNSRIMAATTPKSDPELLVRVFAEELFLMQPTACFQDTNVDFVLVTFMISPPPVVFKTDKPIQRMYPKNMAQILTLTSSVPVRQ